MSGEPNEHRPDAVLPGLARGDVGVVVSSGEAGKSFLLLEAALAVATGADIGGLWQEPIAAGPAYYVCGTDPRAIVRARLKNVLAHGADPDAPPPRGFHALIDDSQAITLFERTGGRVTPHRIFAEVERLMAAQAPRLVVFEHLERYLNRARLDWEDAAVRSDVLRILRASARRLDCAILVALKPWAEVPAGETPAEWDLWLAQDSPGDDLILRYADRRSNSPRLRRLTRGADGVLVARPDEAGR